MAASSKDSHLYLLRRIGTGTSLWPLMYEWQAVRGIPDHLFKPEATIALLVRQGLITVEGGTVRLTEKGAKLASRLQ